jgi:hypothetical protein
MHPRLFHCANAAFAIAILAAPSAVLAEDAAGLQDLRREIEALKSSYEARLQALEQRLKQAEEGARAAAAQAASVPVTPPPPLPRAAASGANAFNPAIGLVLSGMYTHTSRDPAQFAITGFPAGAEIGPGTRGFSLAESELNISANVDPFFRGVLNFAIHPDDSASAEEAFIQTLGLGNGLSVKAGRYFSGFGYLNEQHAHTWDFADNPLVYQAFLGTQFADDGVQVRWLAPTDTYLELGGEAGRGRVFPGNVLGGNGIGAAVAYARTGGDIGVSSSWRAGVSYLQTTPRDERTQLLGTDFVWKWAPEGNANNRNFKLQGEYLWRRRDTTDSVTVAGDPSERTSGWYLQGVYQFMPEWRAGLRYDRLAGDTYDPSRASFMVDWNPSEFSRIRLQFSRDHSREGFADNQLFLQYQMSLGAHGAHNY